MTINLTKAPRPAVIAHYIYHDANGRKGEVATLTVSAYEKFNTFEQLADRLLLDIRTQLPEFDVQRHLEFKE